jgi:CubicO group peptidase (beta-lactamase class C family)
MKQLDFETRLARRPRHLGTLFLALLLPIAGLARGDQKPATKTPQQAAAQVPATPPPAESAPPQMTTADMSAFIDGIVPLQLAKDDIAGAVVVVVKDGQIVFEKGYGYADVKAKRPVSPSATLFRVGSISKLFMWTAVMQMVEQGKLNLDRDVNDYLDFRIPTTYPQPITLRNLMTHTPGFEEAVNDLFVPKATDMVPLPGYVKAHLPARIYPPGTVPAYSNYGATLAGYIVQRVSGMPFDDYIERNIFQPLGMRSSSFRQPLPRLMHSRQFGLVPSMNGMDLGFYQESRSGHMIFGHGGDTVFFHSDLHLMPDAKLGFFVSYNSAGREESAGTARAYLAEKVLERYFPYTPPAAAPPANTAADAAAVAGSYLASRGWETSFMKLASVLGEVRVSAKADGTIEVNAFKGLNGKVKKWTEIEPMIWREVDGQSRLAFRHDAAGRWEMVVDFPAIVFMQAPLLENSRFVTTTLVVIAVIFLLALALWPVAALVRRRYGIKLELGPVDGRMRRLVKLACAINLSVLLGWTIFFSIAGRQPGTLSDQLRPVLDLLMGVGILSIAGSLVVIYNGLRSWRRGDRWWWARVTNLAIALAGIAYVWVVFSMNLLKIGRF